MLKEIHCDATGKSCDAKKLGYCGNQLPWYKRLLWSEPCPTAIANLTEDGKQFLRNNGGQYEIIVDSSTCLTMTTTTRQGKRYYSSLNEGVKTDGVPLHM